MSTHVVVPSTAGAQSVRDDRHGRNDVDQGESAVELGPVQGEVGGGGQCGCGHQDSGRTAGVLPELDARAVPHAIRHGAIFGALDSVKAGSGMVLVAPHDPLPLLAQLERRSPGLFSVDYLERGPQAWRIRLIRA